MGTRAYYYGIMFITIFILSFSCVFAFLSVLLGEMDIDFWSFASYKSIRKVGILFFIFICSRVIWNNRAYVKGRKS